MIEVQMPQLGESVAEGTVTQWHVKPGDYVRREQPLLEVATDKADSDVPSPADGKIVKLAADEGDIVPTGGLLCTIDETATADGGEAEDDQRKREREPEGAARPAAEAEEREPRGQREPRAQREPAKGDDGQQRAPTMRPLTTPSARRLAREEGLDLGRVRGSGERGRITRDDVERAARGGQMPPPSAPPSLPGPPPSIHALEITSSQFEERPPVRETEEIASLMNELPIPGVGYRAYKVPPYKKKPGDEVVPFSRRRRITADHMVYSQSVAPHVVTVAEIDLHATAQLREQHKGAFKKEGIPLTYLAFVVDAAVKALREYPKLNARVLEDSYAVIREVNVGVAVDTPNGLLVANIKNTDQLSLRGIASAIDDVASRARDGKITADDLMGTTFTVSNPGRKGNLFGGAIISQPNVAILRIGEIKKRPVVLERDGEDVIAIHPVMYAALSYDHRIVDGVEANAFLWRIADVLSRGEFDVR